MCVCVTFQISFFKLSNRKHHSIGELGGKDSVTRTQLEKCVYGGERVRKCFRVQQSIKN